MRSRLFQGPGFYRHFKGATYHARCIAFITRPLVAPRAAAKAAATPVTLEATDELAYLFPVDSRAGILVLDSGREPRAHELTTYVIYSNKAGRVFAQTVKSWTSEVSVDGRYVPRFEKLRPQEP